MRLPLISSLLGLALLAGPALAVDFTPQENGSIDFDMPSGNMCCSLTSDDEGGSLLQCTRVEPKYWIVQMSQSGKIDLYKNPGEVPGCGYGKASGNVLEYGETWKRDGYSCTSATNGIRCFANGNGFRLSRAGIKYYD
ncbi:MAG: hypothetical protein LCH46_03955 [Proteobacteria bacterium]|nr:hypothetical protein [Pseudomonadota bacterium]